MKKKTTTKKTAKKKAPTKKAAAKKAAAKKAPAKVVKSLSYTAMCPCGELLVHRRESPPEDRDGNKLSYHVDRCPSCRRLNRLRRSPYNDFCSRCKQDTPREPQEGIDTFQSCALPDETIDEWEDRKMMCGECGRALK